MANPIENKTKGTQKARTKKKKTEKKAQKNSVISKVKKDMYQLVTDKIINALESGVKPWSCPWNQGGGDHLPMNFKSKNFYSGVNVLLLWIESTKKGFSSNCWLTYKQANELGGSVVRGSKGTTIIYYKMLETKNKVTGEDETIPMLKTFTVFNLDQIENIEVPELHIKNDDAKELVKIDCIENIISSVGIDIVNTGCKAFYSPSYDRITLPEFKLFSNSDDYYATAFHEVVHGTGHKSRLARDLKGTFGSKDYAFEELVAEMGAAFCCADVGIIGDVQHECYIAGWLEKLNSDKKFIFKAASLASKAHKFIFDENNSLIQAA